MHTCSDACTHSSQRMEPEVSDWGHTYGPTQGTHVYAKGDLHTQTDICTNSNQGVGPDEGCLDVHMGTQRGAHVCVQLCKGVGVDDGSKVDMLTCTNACTHSNQGMQPNEELLGDAHGATQWHTFPCNYTKGMEKKWIKYLHESIHVHILTEAWNQKKGDWNMHRRPHNIIPFCTVMQWDG